MQPRVSILWDDPYGAESFSRKLKSCIEDTLNKGFELLFCKTGQPLPIVLASSNEEKQLDQQGKGINRYDCGPIVFSNILDYLRNDQVDNKAFASGNHYSIPGQNSSDHFKIIKKARDFQRTMFIDVTQSIVPSGDLSAPENHYKVQMQYMNEMLTLLEKKAWKNGV